MKVPQFVYRHNICETPDTSKRLIPTYPSGTGLECSGLFHFTSGINNYHWVVAEWGKKQNFLYCLYYNLATTFPKQVIIFSPIRVQSYFFFWNLIFGDTLFLLCQEILVSQQMPAVVGSFKVSNNLILEARLTLSVFPYSRVLIHEGPHAWAPWALTFVFHASARLSNTFSRLEQQRYSFLTFTNETCCRISKN